MILQGNGRGGEGRGREERGGEERRGEGRRGEGRRGGGGGKGRGGGGKGRRGGGEGEGMDERNKCLLNLLKQKAVLIGTIPQYPVCLPIIYDGGHTPLFL